MTAELILIRHGETAWNRAKIFRGRADVPLSDRGQRQADLLGQALRDDGIEAIYSSPLSRALETARRLGAPCGIEPAASDGLIDIDYGAWTEQPDAQVAKGEPVVYRQWRSAPDRVRFPDGEALSDVSRRALETVQSTARAHEGCIVLVSHRVPLKLIVLGLLGLGPARFWRVQLNTASVSRFTNTDNGWALCALNDVSHLRQLGSDETDF